MIHKLPTFLFVLLGGIVFLDGCTRAAESHKLESIWNVQKSSLERVITATGEAFSPDSEAVIYERVFDSIWELPINEVIPEGTFVKKGDIVVKMNATTILTRLDNVKGVAEKAQLDYDSLLIENKNSTDIQKITVQLAEIALKKAQIQVQEGVTISRVERQKQLLEVSQAEITLLQTKNDLASMQLQQAKRVEMEKNNLDARIRDVKNTEVALEKISLRAPHDGLLLLPSFHTNAGLLTARPGVSVRPGTTLAEIAPITGLKIRAKVPEVDTQGLATDLFCKVRMDVLPHAVFDGKIYSVARVAESRAEREGENKEPGDLVKTLDIVVDVPTLSKEIFPGMTAQVVCNVFRIDSVIKIPIFVLVDEKHDDILPKEDIVSKVEKFPKAEEAQQIGEKISKLGKAQTSIVENEQKTSKKITEQWPVYTAKVWANIGKEWGWTTVRIQRRSLAFVEVLSGLKDGDKVSEAPADKLPTKKPTKKL